MKKNEIIDLENGKLLVHPNKIVLGMLKPHFLASLSQIWEDYDELFEKK